MIKIKKAIISVSDKSNLNNLLKILKKYKIEIISSGGTYKKIKKLSYKSTEISNFTGFPEILSGRVKTLHPRIYGGILSKRKSELHKKDLVQNNIKEIDLVIVNFYPFDRTMKETNDKDKIIEKIDIGGPTLVRAAAKNFERVVVVSSVNQYIHLIKELKKYNGCTSLIFRQKMSKQAFKITTDYDKSIYNYLNKGEFENDKIKNITLIKSEDLRYGENPHQKASLYNLKQEAQNLNQLNGKKMSYNNYYDVFAALQISESLPKNRGTVVVKHGNPSGVSIEKSKVKSYDFAVKCDPVSAFGGVISCNYKINYLLAKEIKKKFFEVLCAKGFEKKALKILKSKKNLRIIDSSKIKKYKYNNIVSSFNNILVQTPDDLKLNKKNFKVVSKVKPSKKMMENLIYAFNICRFVKSNAIVITKNFSTIGIGSGQPSRVDSCKIAIEKMKKFHKSFGNEIIYAASDAFFPFVDGIEELVIGGVRAIIQPYGSIRDKEIIKFANKLGIVLVFSKTRHFKH